MIVCPNCNHQNPDGATLCETCYTPLPVGIHNPDCPNCGAEIPVNATFCGQCGTSINPSPSPEKQGDLDEQKQVLTIVEPLSPVSSTEEIQEDLDKTVESLSDETEIKSLPENDIASETNVISNQTKLQVQKASLFHVQTDTVIDIPSNLAVIHIGKPNEKIPPDIDVSGFPNSQVVSRIHADIRQEADAFYLEDTGSANGTYVNHIPLPTGNRHRLRTGDRIALGKEDKVSFIFQLNEE